MIFETSEHGMTNPDTHLDTINIVEISKTFGRGEDAVVALGDVTLSIRQNEFFTLLGPSGCGKTTLLRLIAGFDHPTGGKILLEGQDISHLAPYARPVNTVFQNYALFPHMTVGQNIAFGLEMLGKPRSEVTATVGEMLRLVQMEDLKDRQTAQISGGQQQRVALARALAPKPKVLLLDEPLSALDLKLRKEMQIELKRLQHETGITFVFVTHDQEEALTMSDRIAVLDGGNVLQVGTPREIYGQPASRFVANFIGDTNFFTAQMTRAGENGATLSLATGKVVQATLSDATIPVGPVTVVVRPEHVNLTADSQKAALAGVVENIVFFGTDTHYHLRLDDGAGFIVRSQNQPGSEKEFSVGDRLGIQIRDNAINVLRD
jgi:spermidine/putrescine transport system ATP-binding protein